MTGANGGWTTAARAAARAYIRSGAVRVSGGALSVRDVRRSCSAGRADRVLSARSVLVECVPL